MCVSECAWKCATWQLAEDTPARRQSSKRCHVSRWSEGTTCEDTRVVTVTDWGDSGTHSRAAWGGLPSSSLRPLVSSSSVTTQHNTRYHGYAYTRSHNHRDRSLLRERSLFHFPCSHFLLLYITIQILLQQQQKHGSEILQLLLWISRRKYVIKKL